VAGRIVAVQGALQAVAAAQAEVRQAEELTAAALEKAFLELREALVRREAEALAALRTTMASKERTLEGQREALLRLVSFSLFCLFFLG
jgi:RecA/RadA recombinase